MHSSIYVIAISAICLECAASDDSNQPDNAPRDIQLAA